MADKIRSNLDSKMEVRKGSSTHKTKESLKESRDISKKYKEGIGEVVADTETSEFIDGEISESSSEGKKRVGDSYKGGSSATGDDSTLADDDFVFPKVDVMRIQISTKIKKEISTLEKEAKKMLRNPAKFSPFHFNSIVSRIRRLKDIVASLAHATGETVKSLWERYVKSTAK